MDTLTIGQLADRAGVGVETIRFYERKGLMPKPKRRESGYRQFADEDVERVRFIRQAKELGFSLKEITDLLGLRVGRGSSCASVRQRAETKIDEIGERIRTLNEMKRALGRLAKRCNGRGPTGDCPLLEELSGKASRHG